MGAQPGFGMVSVVCIYRVYKQTQIASLLTICPQRHSFTLPTITEDSKLNRFIWLLIQCIFSFSQPPAGGPGAPMMPPLMGQPLMGQPMMRPPFIGVGGAPPGAAAPGAPVTHHTHWNSFPVSLMIARLFVSSVKYSVELPVLNLSTPTGDLYVEIFYFEKMFSIKIM